MGSERYAGCEGWMGSDRFRGRTCNSFRVWVGEKLLRVLEISDDFWCLFPVVVGI